METIPTYNVTEDEDLMAPDTFNFIVNDGGALMHGLPGTSVQGKSFDEYFLRVFYPRIQYQLRRSQTVHVVWDQYSTLSIKGTTREKRGHGTRQRVCGSKKVPGNWHSFLSHPDNKT